MLRSSDIDQFVRACSQIGDELADQTGFVTIRGLLSRFRADLTFRPLLVEAMLASVDQGGVASDYQWSVLVDSETHQASQDALDREHPGESLGVRLRNTIAHELTHALAFRYADFGIRLNVPINIKDRKAFVEEIERETERLSPLLLIPDKALLKLVEAAHEQITVEALSGFRDHMGVSRKVLVNRFNMLRKSDRHGLLNRPPLRNLAIGIGEWRTPKEAILRSWPLYTEFNKAIVPSFLLRLPIEDRIPLSSVLPSGRDAEIHTGVIFNVRTGSSTSPNMDILLQCEHVAPRSRAEFLFTIRNATKGKFEFDQEARIRGRQTQRAQQE